MPDKPWNSVLELDSQRNIVSGSEAGLADAIRNAADLRIYTEFLYNEHIDPLSDCTELIQEVSEFAVTYLVKDSWSAGLMSLRQPMNLAAGFGPRASMSFFLYNQNGQQAIGRPYLDNADENLQETTRKFYSHPEMPKMHIQSQFDQDTNAPAQNFIYDFESYRYCVRDDWKEVLSHDAEGNVVSGDIDALIDTFVRGGELKAAVRSLCDSLSGDGDRLDHELFTRAGPGYYFTERNLFVAGSHPIIRVKPGVPMLYESGGWDFGWLSLRTNGRVIYRRCDPYTLKFEDLDLKFPIRWFVRG
jgi:hypothetical protein